MLRKRRLPKYRIGHRPMTEEQKRYLLDVVASNGSLEIPFESEQERRVVWFQNRERLLREHIAAKPGTRPSAWWAYEAPEPRQLLSGVVEQVGKELYCGMPVLTKDIYEESQFETEYDYLKRLGLLFDSEIQPRETACVGVQKGDA